MKRLKNPKGVAHFYSIIAGVVMVALIIFFLGYYNSHRGDINVHTPPAAAH